MAATEVEIVITHGEAQGKCLLMPVSQTTTVGDVVQLLKEKFQLEFEQRNTSLKGINLFNEHNTVESKQRNDDLLFEYMNSYGRILCTLLFETPRERGTAGRGRDFADVSNEEAKITRKWSAEAPEWRIVKKGLVIEGRCENSSCKAFGGMVCCNMGFMSFNLMKMDSYKIECALCHNPVKAIKPGYNNCFYQITGRKSSLSTYSTTWTEVGDTYVTYDEEKAGSETWLKLEIHTKPLESDRFKQKIPMPNECCICHKNLIVSSDDITLSDCGHYYHKSCKAGLISNCITKEIKPTCPMDGDTLVVEAYVVPSV